LAPDPAEKEREAFVRYLRRPSPRRLARVVSLFQNHVWTVALRVSGNEEDALDVCQDVFLSLLLSPPKPGSVRSPRGYLSYRVLTLCERLARAGQRRRHRETEAARRLSSDALGPGGDLEAVRKAVQSLPERIKRVIELRYLAGLSSAEIGNLLGISERSVAGDLQRGKGLLRKRLEGTILGALAILGNNMAGELLAAPPKVGETLSRIADGGGALVSLRCTASAASKALAGKKALASIVTACFILSATGAAMLVAPLGLPTGISRSEGRLAASSEPGRAEPETTRAPAARPRVEGGPPLIGLPPPVDFARADRDLDIFGFVKTPGGEPIPGTKVECVTYPWRRVEVLNAAGSSEAKLGPGARTAADGSFCIHLRRGECVNLRVSSPGHAFAEVPCCLAGGFYDIALPESSRLEVAAEDEAGSPVAGARLRFLRPAGEATRDERVGITGADGRHAFLDMYPGAGWRRPRAGSWWSRAASLSGKSSPLRCSTRREAPWRAP
jgi:RNA polymerase sigma factor (sigma-70 family)